MSHFTEGTGCPILLKAKCVSESFLLINSMLNIVFIYIFIFILFIIIIINLTKLSLLLLYHDYIIPSVTGLRF